MRWGILDDDGGYFITYIWRILLPLVEGTPLEHRLERDEEDGYDRKAAQLVGIAAPQNLAIWNSAKNR